MCETRQEGQGGEARGDALDKLVKVDDVFGNLLDGVFEEDLRKQLRVAVRFAKAGFDGRVGEEVE